MHPANHPANVRRTTRALIRESLLRILFPGAVLTTALMPLLARSNYVTVEETARQRQIQKMREGGFRDIAVDELQSRIGANLQTILDKGILVPRTQEMESALKEGYARRLHQGQDASGAKYLRVAVREHVVRLGGEVRSYWTHCYLYPSTTQKGALARVVFQIYRYGYDEVGHHYGELRRIVQPSPAGSGRIDAVLAGDPIVANDNSNLSLEYYSSTGGAIPLGADGIALPDLNREPEMRIALNDPADPLEYDRQIRLLQRYKGLLIEVDKSLERLVRIRELNRGYMIEKGLDLQD